MSQMNRRDFIRSGFQTLAGLVAMDVLRPSLLFADGPIGLPKKNLVVFFANGGLDGLFSTPYRSGLLANAINQEFRPTIHVSPQDIDSVTPTAFYNAQAGHPNILGFHPAWGPLLSEAGDHMAVLTRVGFPNFISGSHSEMYNCCTSGRSNYVPGLARGWLAEAMRVGQMNAMQAYGVGLMGRSTPFIGDAAYPERPTVVARLSQFNYQDRYSPTHYAGTYNNQDSFQVRQLRSQLLALAQAGNPLKENYKSILESIPGLVGEMSQVNTISPQGQYTSNYLGSAFRDAARLLTYKSQTPNLQNKPTLMHIEDFGFDNHGEQISKLNGLLDGLARNLSAFVQDLKTNNLWNDTLILVMSEFGRQHRENSADAAIAGSDHGWANNLMLLGGKVQTKVFGDDWSLSEMQNQASCSATIDMRSLIAFGLSWIGLDPQAILPETYNVAQTAAMQQALLV